MKKFSAKYRVYYEDTDAGRVMYYANYLKFFERARTDFLREIGILQNELMENEKIAFVVRRCEVDYAAPARLDDLVEVDAVIEKISGASIVMKQQMRCSEQLLAALQVEIVCVDVENFRAKKIPQNLRELLRVGGF